MATKKRRTDEGGSGAETKGRVPDVPDEGPYGDTEIEPDLDLMRQAGLEIVRVVPTTSPFSVIEAAAASSAAAFSRSPRS